MVIRNNSNPKIERHKQKLGLTGDVYLINDLLIESLESHKTLIPNSTATTIEEAEEERIEYEKEQEELRKAQAETQGLDEGEVLSGYTVNLEFYTRPDVNVYDGQDNTAPLLAQVKGINSITRQEIAVTCTSGYLYIEAQDDDSIPIGSGGLPSGGVEQISSTGRYPFNELYSVGGNGLITNIVIETD